jgi:hypothetical protein
MRYPDNPLLWCLESRSQGCNMPLIELRDMGGKDLIWCRSRCYRFGARECLEGPK